MKAKLLLLKNKLFFIFSKRQKTVSICIAIMILLFSISVSYPNLIFNLSIESLISFLSMIIAGYSLYKSSVNNAENSFNERFTLLLEQHDKAQASLIKYLDKENNIIGTDGLMDWICTPDEASRKLYQNHNFSPYMRTLFHILKFINNDFYKRSFFNELDFNKEKKKYSSLIRSLIRNDVLYFVALNSLNNDKTFDKYRKLLNDFYFFEHLIIENISDGVIFKSDYILLKYKSKINDYLIGISNEYINENVYMKSIYRDKEIINNELILNATFPLIISKLYVNDSYVILKNKIITMLNEINFSFKIDNIMGELSVNTFFIGKQFLHECTSRYEKNTVYMFYGDNVKVFRSEPYVILDEANYISDENENVNEFITRLGLLDDKKYFFSDKNLNGDVIPLGNTTLTPEQFYDNCILITKKKKLDCFIKNDIDVGINNIKTKLVSDINNTALMKSIEEELALSDEGRFFFKIKK